MSGEINMYIIINMRAWRNYRLYKLCSEHDTRLLSHTVIQG